MEKLSSTKPEDIEANRIVGEFMATLAGDGWSAKGLAAGNAQPRTRKEHTDFLMSAFDSEDVFDFANPDDVAAFANVYRRPCRKGPQACG